MGGKITLTDFRILDFIKRKTSCGFMDFMCPKVSFLGNCGLIWLLAAAVMFAFKSTRTLSLVLVSGLIVGVLICNLLLKNTVARPRPCHLLPESARIRIPKDYSFPSGHTMSSFIAASILAEANFWMGVIAIVLAALIGFSRLYLYVHFPSDVVIGAVLGTLSGIMVWHAALMPELSFIFK
ncbi:MAG: phosphatase PAP2 family protein [Ruminococcus sp.]|nr:phosphatase PAP2 family protein [Ruminococcus sp.]